MEPAAQGRRLARLAALAQQEVQPVDVLGARDRDPEGPPYIAHHAFDVAFVISLSGPTEAILEQVMGLQHREHRAPLPRPVSEASGAGRETIA